MNNLKTEIKNVYEQNPNRRYNLKQIVSRLELNLNEVRDEVHRVLEELYKDGVIDRIDSDSYSIAKDKLPRVKGKIDMTSTGMAYVIVEGREKDIIVEPKDTNQSMHNDIVEVVIITTRKDGREQGEVVDILQKTKRTFVGRIEMLEEKNFAFVIIDSKKVIVDIFVPERYFNGAENNQKVLVEITEWTKGTKNPTGRIIDVLGDVGDNDTEMHAILSEYDLPYQFPSELEDIADKIPTVLDAKEISKRRDMRSITTFTIDPADAKDFDDALSIERLPNGNWEIGVHIADVTHYVKPGSEIDTEAISRATSVYLVDRTVPMLPEKLSNFLCSLRPNEDKFTFSAVFELNDNAEIIKEWFGRTVTHSDRRFTYEEAQKVIETKEGELVEEILTMDRLAKILRADRFRHGSIGFERDEAKFILDENGKPLGVYFKKMKDSNKLIEEFMLLANHKVAQFIGQSTKKRTFIYRIHDTPNEEKFEKFKRFITTFGFYIKADKSKAIAKELTKILQEVKGTPEESIISTLAIRSMAKATYSTNNIGHYGLAFDYYSHFTSPIRRYPDMMVHRLLQHYLDNGKSANEQEYEELCEHSSAQEIKASNAERDSIKYKMVEFMEDKIGEHYEGVVSGVTEWGVFVELCETKIEGMVSVRDLTDDFYNFDGESYSLIGHKTGRRFRLGDIVKISIKRADLKRKQLDFEMLGTVDFHTKEFTALPITLHEDRNRDRKINYKRKNNSYKRKESNIR